MVAMVLVGACAGSDKHSIVLTTVDSAPDFDAMDFQNQPTDLKALTRNGPLVLVFLRGFG